MDVRQAKQELRARLRAARDGTDADHRADAALAIAERVAAEVEGLGLVMGFLAFGSEVPTLPILDRLDREGHALAVPHIAGDELVPVGFVPGEDLRPAVWGIPEPATIRPVDPETIDAVIAPGLGFDRRGYRVGYGGGYYDRLLARVRPDALRIGIGLHLQIVAEVPNDDRDQRMNIVVTERETITCR